ncbi:MAG: hypothetical protein H5T45_04585 [Thermoplasmatales archaeon]|nr:hypothetical protein [Thermoplasmatales archaeon]
MKNIEEKVREKIERILKEEVERIEIFPVPLDGYLWGTAILEDGEAEAEFRIDENRRIEITDVHEF